MSHCGTQCHCANAGASRQKSAHPLRTVALIGNQNCGKTTLFNALTGSNQYVGNWPGVTVDRVSGRIASLGWDVVDLPGLYSLSPYSAEEVVSRDFLLSDSYDVILNVIDATHLEHSLSLTYEILTLNRPVVIALNMMDLLRKDRRMRLDAEELSKRLGVPVIPVCAATGEGLADLLNAISKTHDPAPAPVVSVDVQEAVDAVGSVLGSDLNDGQRRFIATSLLQLDKIYSQKYLDDPKINKTVHQARDSLSKKHGTDPEALFAEMRYEAVDALSAAVLKKNANSAKTISAKIDDIVTNRILALPIFCGIIYLIYYLAVSTLGTWSTDYANDVIFGEWCTNAAEYLLSAASAPEWLSSLIIEGVIGGVGAVLGFVPQMIVLFFLLSLLEQCGYMTRVAFVLDRLFRHFGLSGRSFIPILIATGCAVPAMMATRTLDNINERRITLLTASFMPCSAKMPIITMIVVSFFPDSVYIAPLIYMMAIFSIAATGIILKKDRAFHEDVSPFVMELPDYHMPGLRNLLITVYERCKAFVVKAGTVIFTTVVAVWFLSSFGFGPDGFGMVEVSESMLAAFGSAIAFIFVPLGFGSWQASVAVLTGLLAKENVVGTLAVLLGLGEDVAEDSESLAVAVRDLFPGTLAAFAYLAFNLWSTPCIAALAAMKRQFGSGKWFAFAVSYMLLWAYGLAIVIFQIGGLLLGTVPFSMFTVAAFAVLAVFAYLLFRPDRSNGASSSIAFKSI